MIAGFPNGSPSQAYLGTIASLLCTYPRSIATRCADPVRGVARTTKFLPTVADVVAWCEPDANHMRRIVDLEENTQRQFEERDKREAELRAEPLQLRMAVVERVRREMAEAGLPFESDRKLFHGETETTVKERFKISDEQWAAIPNQPGGVGYWQGVRTERQGTK